MAITPWLEGYERDPEPGAGLPVLAGGDKFVIHTTESPRGSLGGIRNTWRGAGAWGKGLAHFLGDGSRVVQNLPLDVNGYTLENKPGGTDTNKSGHVIQVEWCRRAADPWQDDELTALAKLIADCIKAGLQVDPHNHPEFYGPGCGWTLASYDARQRFSADRWTAGGFWAGHVHAPENAHWDPGYLDAKRVEDMIVSNLGATPTKHEEDDDVARLIWSTKGAYLVAGNTKRVLSPHEVDVLRLYKVDEAQGKHDELLACYTDIPRDKISGSER